MEMGIFLEITLVLILALVLSVALRFLRQPVILAYILTGFLIGPVIGTSAISKEVFSVFSEFGVALLLFLVGLQISPKLFSGFSKNILLLGLLQVAVTSFFGFGLIRFLGFGIAEAIYAGIALSFSSTIIIAKLLSDRGDFSALYGRITLGILLVQDAVAIVLFIIMPNLNPAFGISGTEGLKILSLPLFYALSVAGAAFLLLYLFKRFLLPVFSRFAVRNQDTLFIFALAWAAGISALFKILGFSLEGGALIAGIALSAAPFQLEIYSKLRPIRDFFIIIFFVMLGMRIDVRASLEMIWPVAVVVLFIIILKPLIMFAFSGLSGYKKRTIFGVGVSMGQISEFSFILLAAGIGVGFVSENLLNIVTVAGLVSIAVSSYLIQNQEKIMSFADKFLRLFESKNTREEFHEGPSYSDIILFGYNRIGFNVVESCKKIGRSVFVIDYDPDVIKILDEQGTPALYGDANNLEFVKSINFQKAKMVISTIPETKINLDLVKIAKGRNKNIIFISIAHDTDEAKTMYANKADFVILPHFLGGEYAGEILLKNMFNREAYKKMKKKEYKMFEHRKKLGHIHPSVVSWFR